MNSVLVAASIAGVAIAAYAVLGGADFGGGVWDLCANGPRAQAQRTAIARAIGPVWEANHVWLIFVIVTVFTCFPSAFADLAIRLYVPLTLIAIGVVLRGAAFVFRAHAYQAARASLVLGGIFAVASLITPFGFGMAVGELLTLNTIKNPGVIEYLSPFSLLLGCFAVALCAQIAAVFLTLETREALREDFRGKAIIATVAVAMIGAVTLCVSDLHALHLVRDIMRGKISYEVGFAMVLGLVTLGTLFQRRFALARIAVIGEVLAVLGGWYGAQIPYILPPSLTFSQAAAPEATLRAFLLLTAVGSCFLVPALALLFLVFKGQNPAIDER